MPDLTPAELDAIEQDAAGLLAAMPHLGTLAKMFDVCFALRAAWEERDRLRRLVETAYKEGAAASHQYGWQRDLWDNSTSRRALTPPGEGATDG